MKTIKHIALTALALSVGALTGFAQTPVFSDHFDDQNLPGWSGEKTWVSQQMVLSANFGAFNPNDALSTHLATQHLIPGSGPLPDQHTLEMRVDWVAPHQNDAMAGIHALWLAWPAHAYSLFVDEDEVILAKC